MTMFQACKWAHIRLDMAGHSAGDELLGVFKDPAREKGRLFLVRNVATVGRKFEGQNRL